MSKTHILKISPLGAALLSTGLMQPARAEKRNEVSYLRGQMMQSIQPGE